MCLFHMRLFDSEGSLFLSTAMQGLEIDVVAAQEVFVCPQTVEEFAFGEPPLPRAGLGRGHAGDIVLDAAAARKAAIAFDLALLANEA
jgi:hypothetical protein